MGKIQNQFQGMLGYVLVALLAYCFGAGSSRSNWFESSMFSHQEEGFQETAHRRLASPLSLSSVKDLSVVTTVILLLIGLTIMFELYKDYLEDSASRIMKPIVNKLFAELTVLGFLSVLCFVITRAGFFGMLGRRLFQNSTTLLEIFDFVHYTIFFVMILFVFQVYVLVVEALRLEKMWLQMDRLVRNPELSQNFGEFAFDFYDKTMERKRKKCSRFLELMDLMPLVHIRGAAGDEDLILFKSLRDEFILERGLDPPFAPAAKSVRVDDDFNYGKYLSHCTSQLLTQVVELSITTWSAVAILTIVHFVYCLMLVDHVHVLAWSWVVAGWAVYFGNVVFENHLIEVRRAFAKKELFADHSAQDDNDGDVMLDALLEADETTYLNHRMHSDKSLPLWTEVDMEQYMTHRPWWKTHFVGGVPNQQQTFYWMDRKGPKVYLFILQANLIFIGVYFAVNVLGLMEYMWTQGLFMFTLYFFLTVMPFVGLLFFKQHLVAVLSQVCCMGTYRRPGIVSDVLREEKTAHVVRAFLVIYKMRMLASGDFREEDFDRTEAALRRQTFDEYEIHEVAKTFDAFDPNGDGNISADEFEELMYNLGASVTSRSIQKMIAVLDRDSNGMVSREEFIDWYASSASDEVGEGERALYLFKLFDTKDTGEITIGEFKGKLDALNVGFTLDEIGAIVKELDEDENGTIGLEEFTSLLKRYHPEELQPNRQSSLLMEKEIVSKFKGK